MSAAKFTMAASPAAINFATEKPNIQNTSLESYYILLTRIPELRPPATQHTKYVINRINIPFVSLVPAGSRKAAGFPLRILAIYVLNVCSMCLRDARTYFAVLWMLF